MRMILQILIVGDSGDELSFITGRIVDGGIEQDFVASDFPCALNDPGDGTILSQCFFLDFIKHIYGEVNALFSLIGFGIGLEVYFRHDALSERIELQ